MAIPDLAATARYVAKANVVTSAWKALYGSVPTKHAVVLAMAVAEFETHLGDAGGSWKGEHNWGAVHKRSLTGGEASVLLMHGVFATGGEPSLATARGLVPATAPDEALHIDDSPTGKYFVWFWAFPDDVTAAKKFLQTLVGNRPAVRAVIDQGTPADLAKAMYESKYFTGVHKNDPAANIRDYATNVAAKAQAIELGLLGWDPAHAAEPPAAAPVAQVAMLSAALPTVPTLPGAPASPHSAAPFIAFGLALAGGLAFATVRARSKAG